MKAARLAGMTVLAFLAACGDQAPKEWPVSIAPGVYRVAYTAGLTLEDQALWSGATAQIDRAAGTLTLTHADESIVTFDFAPRPRDQWQTDCFTMTGHSLNEVADLAPALEVGSTSWPTPVVYAFCSETRLVLANAYGAQDSFVAFDLE